MLKIQAPLEVEEFAWGRIEWLVSHAQGNSDSLTAGRVTIRAGQSNSLHRHPNCDEILVLLQGRLEHRVGEEVFSMQSGDTVSIPINAWHNAQSTGAEDAVMLVCYSSAQRQTQLSDEIQS